MKYAVFTYSGEGIPVALKLKAEGNDVYLGMIEDNKATATRKELKQFKPEDKKEKERRLKTADGLIRKQSADSLMKFLKGKKDFFVFYDMNLCFRYAEALSKYNFLGNHPTEQDRIFETDRNAAKEFVKKNYPGIEVASVQEFKKVKDAQEFLKDTDKLWVLKGLDDDAKTVVPNNDDPKLASQQILEALTNGQKLYEKQGFILEQKIANVIEVTPQKVWYDGVPVYTDIDLENKRINSAETGIMTGCAQDLVFETPMDAKINKLAFPKAVDDLAKKHKGIFIWDLSILFDPKSGKPYMGEFCPNRFGYNALYTEITLNGNATGYFNKIINKKSPLRQGFASSVRIFNRVADSDIPGFARKDMKIIYKDLKNIWLMDVYKKDDLFTAGYSKDLCVATGLGKTIEESATDAYKNAEQISNDDFEKRPLFDYLSKDYNSSIINRYNYLKQWI